MSFLGTGRSSHSLAAAGARVEGLSGMRTANSAGWRLYAVGFAATAGGGGAFGGAGGNFSVMTMPSSCSTFS